MRTQPGAVLKWGVAAAAGMLLLSLCGSQQVDNQFKRWSVAANLEAPATFLVDAAAVQASPFAPCQWARGARLDIKLLELAPGHLVTLKLRSDHGEVPLLVRAGGQDLGKITVTPEWQRHQVVAVNDSPLLVLHRVSNLDQPVHIARISHSNTVGHAGTPLTGWVLSRLLPHEPPHAALCGLACAAWCALVLVATTAWFVRARQRSLAQGLAVATLTLLPACVLLAGLQVAWWSAGLRVIYPGSTFLALVGMAPGAVIATGGVRLLAAWFRRRFPDFETMLEQRQRPMLRTCLATALGLGTVVVVLVVLLPRSPFEWDEVLFARALDGFDVARHRPHPPGYPVFMAAGTAMRLVVGDPIRSLQLVSVAAAVLCLLFTMKLMRRLEAPTWPTGLAAVLLACLPAFSFYANVGLSDLTGTAAAVVAVWAMSRVLGSPQDSRLLVTASLLSAVAMGVRPQLAVVLAGPGLVVLWTMISRRSWRPLGLAAVAGVATSVVVWLPPVLLTGADRYFSAAEAMGTYMAQREAGGRLPGISLADAAQGWLLRPLGPAWLAVVFWTAAVMGAVVWWRRDRRRLVALAGLAAGGHLLVSPWLLEAGTAVRYVLPALPFAAILASGVVLAPWPRLRLPALASLLVVATTMVVWTAPAALLRARETAPVWAALEWVRDSIDPASAVVVHDGEINPHAQYILSPAGFECFKADTYHDRLEKAGRFAVRITSPAPAGASGLFAARWNEDRIAQLTRRRYRSCVVRSAGEVPVLEMSSQWRGVGWRRRLDAVGRLWVDHATTTTAVQLGAAAGAATLRRGAEGSLTLAEGSRVTIPVGRGDYPALRVGPELEQVVLDPVRLTPVPELEPQHTVWIPAVSNGPEGFATSWRSDLELSNQARAEVRCRLDLVTAPEVGRATATVSLAPATSMTVTDLVPALFGTSGRSALAIGCDAEGVAVSSRMLLAAPGTQSPIAIEALTTDQAVDVERPGTIRLSSVLVHTASSLSLGVVNAGERNTVAHVAIRTDAGKTVLSLELPVAPFSYATRALPRRDLVNADSDLVLVIRSNGRGKPIFAHLVVDAIKPTRWHYLAAMPTGP